MYTYSVPFSLGQISPGDAVLHLLFCLILSLMYGPSGAPHSGENDYQSSPAPLYYDRLHPWMYLSLVSSVAERA